MKNVNLNDLKQTLTPEQYKVAVEKATEIPFTGKYLDTKEPGVYKCLVCGVSLFSSQHKFDSGSGWPSFHDVVEAGNVELAEDNSHGMHRTEVKCANCGAHLGHLFNDGPQPNGKRYCINSCVLDFEKS